MTTLSSEPSEVDPHPELPGCFADQDAVGKLVREVKSIRSEGGGPADGRAADDGDETSAADNSPLESLAFPAETDESADGGDDRQAPAAAEAKQNGCPIR